MEVAPLDIAIISLLLIISAVGIATRPSRVPYPVALVVTGLLLGALLRSPLLFGAIVAATGPIAVLAIFKRTGAPRDLAVLVEGESLFNDGTAVVLSRILIGVVLTGAFDIAGGVLDFALVVGGGLVVGGLAGAMASRLTAWIDDHLIEITLTTILTYGTFILAEALHVSGVIAVVVAGLVLGNIGARRGMSPTTRLALLTFWEYVAFLQITLITQIGYCFRKLNLRNLRNLCIRSQSLPSERPG